MPASHSLSICVPNRCVDGGCANLPDPSNIIDLHKFPKESDLDRKRRRNLVAFVQTKRAKSPNRSPTANSRFCSQHVQTKDFESPFTTIPASTFVSRAVLKRDVVPYNSQNSECAYSIIQL